MISDIKILKILPFFPFLDSGEFGALRNPLTLRSDKIAAWLQIGDG